MRKIIKVACKAIDGAIAIGCVIFLVALAIMAVGAEKGERLFCREPEREMEK